MSRFLLGKVLSYLSVATGAGFTHKKTRYNLYHTSIFILKNSSFNGFASTTYFDRNVFIPNLDQLESNKLTSESCSVVYRGQLYVYG